MRAARAGRAERATRFRNPVRRRLHRAHDHLRQYDWRGRTTQVYLLADDSGRTAYTQTTYDNLDRTTEQERYPCLARVSLNVAVNE